MQTAEKVIDAFAVILTLAIAFILFVSQTFPSTIFIKMYDIENAENPEHVVFAATWICVFVLMAPFFYVVKRSLRY